MMRKSVSSVSITSEFYDVVVVQSFHGVDLAERSIGPMPINDLDSHLYSSQNLPGQLHLGRVSLANGVQELIVPNAELLVSRDGCKVM